MTEIKLLPALERIAKTLGGDPSGEPVDLVLRLASEWKRRGGDIEGKPRHSNRYLDEFLRRRGTPIRSLTPKLKGRTNLSAEDARVLVRLFLSHWDYTGDPKSREISNLYTPFFSDGEIEAVSRHIVDRISQAGTESKGDTSQAPVLGAPGQSMPDLIVAEFEKSLAMFTIGAGQAVLVPRPELALIGFRDLMNRLWEIDKDEDPGRILIWTLDLGRQDFYDVESRLRFMNVQSLIARFQALKRFQDYNKESRWDWLKKKSVIVLHDTLGVRPDTPPVVSALPTFDPNHVLFSAIPPKWLALAEFRALYGSGFERLRDANYSIFLSSDSVGGDISSVEYRLHYFGHARFKSDEKGDYEPRGLELTEPGRSYVEALSTVYSAATQILKLRDPPDRMMVDGLVVNRADAVSKLRHHGLVLLRLDEFLNY